MVLLLSKRGTDVTTHKITITVHSRWVAWSGSALAVAVIVAAGWFLVLRSGVLRAQSAMNCSGQYLIDVTLPVGSRWEMCWEVRDAEGIVFHDIYFTPAGGPRREVLGQANLAQIHVPYDDNGARFHDVSDFGLGGINIDDLTDADCPNGTLLVNAGKHVLCLQILPRGYDYKYFAQQLQGNALSLYSVSHVGQYNYVPTWRFLDNGTIEPTIGATGKLQRFNYNSAASGWPIRVDQGGQVYAIAHMHNYFWRLDFDIDGPQNDQVEEFEFTPVDNNYSYQVSVTPFLTETARTVNPARMRSWRVRDTVTANGDGHAISYHLDPLRVGHIHQGPAAEPFTNNQFYVTVNKPCEKYSSHNPEIQCASGVSWFVNGESLVGQDIVVWYGITFHHLPRDEDESMMDAHWDGFQLTPRDWTATNPLDNVVPAPASTATSTPTSTSTSTPTSTVTSTPIPPTAAATGTVPAAPTAVPTNTAVALPTGTHTPEVPTATSPPMPTNESPNTPAPGATVTDTPVLQTPTPIGSVDGTPAPGLDNLTNPLFLPQIGK